MCGIAGIVDFGGGPPVEEATLLAMAQSLTHRGPDDEGIYRSPDGRAGLAHRRLSVIDLAGGHQPLCNEDGTLWICYNGECYNFKSLRQQLLAQGHTFKTHCDTETILHLYEEYGSACVNHLRGMFAFAIWDERNQQLFLARDRLGQKPLYYTLNNGRICFGSECKAILQDPGFTRRVNHEAITGYLLLGYVRGPESAFEGIYQLPPAHHLTLSASTCSIARPVCYWTIPSPQSAETSRATPNLKAAAEQIRATLTEAVQLRMISDVPLGAFLSGGIDSSCIAALMTQIGGRPIEACAIGFEEGLYNELDWARRAASPIKANLHETIVRPDLADAVQHLAHHYDEPFADSSALPTWYLSKMARSHVTVALTGDGGDELFGGYRRYQALARAALLSSNLLLHWIGNLRFWRNLKTPEHHSTLRNLKRFFTALNLPPDRQYLHWIAVFQPELLRKLLKSPLPADWNPTAAFAGCHRPAALLNQALYFDATCYLPGDLNTKIDRASMAFGLELRSPFQDHLLVEQVNRLPLALRHDGTHSKRLLKHICKGLIPTEIINRPKMGFGVPVGHWFRGPLKDLLHDTLLAPSAHSAPFFNQPALQSLIASHQSNRDDHGHQLWSLLMLELWLRNYHT